MSADCHQAFATVLRMRMTAARVAVHILNHKTLQLQVQSLKDWLLSKQPTSKWQLPRGIFMLAKHSNGQHCCSVAAVRGAGQLKLSVTEHSQHIWICIDGTLSLHASDAELSNLKSKFVHRLRQRGYPQRLLASITSRVSFSQRHQYLSASSSSKAATASSKSIMVVPYAQLMPELQLQQLLRDAYENGGGDLHTLVPERPIVAFTKSRNLGSYLVKASH
jgi:hypothetical protein